MATVVAGFRDVDEKANTPSINGTPIENESKLVQQSKAANLHPTSGALTRTQWMILLTCGCCNIFMHMEISTIPLVLPPEIVAKEIPYEFTGMIFSIFAISIIIFEPFQAKILPRFGTMRVFCFGTFLEGLCIISFGLLEYANTTASFVAPAMILRFIDGFLLITGTNVVVCLAFPNRASFGFGCLEGFVGAGYVLGPILGGPLYKVGGFSASFILFGLGLLLTSFLGFCTLEQITGLDLEARPKEKKRLIGDPIFIGSIMLVFSMGFVWGIFETALQPYLANYAKGSIIEGLVFAIAYLSYALMSPIWGFIFRKVHIDFRWVLLGPVFVGIVWMFFGPIPIMEDIGSSLWLDTLCLVLINCGIAFVFVFSYDTMLKRAVLNGLEENIATYAMVVASFFTAVYMGQAVGPIVGGYITARADFATVAAAAAGMSFVMTVVAGITMLINWRNIGTWSRERLHIKFPSYISLPDSGESSPLISRMKKNSGGNTELQIFYRPSVDLQTGAWEDRDGEFRRRLSSYNSILK